jgi:hypothetical protein
MDEKRRIGRKTRTESRAVKAHRGLNQRQDVAEKTGPRTGDRGLEQETGKNRRPKEHMMKTGARKVTRREQVTMARTR